MAAETEAGEQPEILITTVPSREAPVDLGAILRQSGFQIETAVEKMPTMSPAPVDDLPVAGDANEQPVNIVTPIPQSPKPTGATAEDDGTIDDYMSRLLARARGGAMPSSPPKAPFARSSVAVASESVSRAVASPVVPASPLGRRKPGEPLDLAPRTIAPEKQADWQAMRQLANLSANCALGKHESKRLSRETRAKMLVLGVSAVASVALLIFSQLPGAPRVAIYSAAASFAVAILSVASYLSLMSRLSGARTACMSGPLKTGERSVAEGNAASDRQVEP